MGLTAFLFTCVATLYSSIGHAGASGYLAIMALLSFEPSAIKPTSLVLNITVAAISSYNFIKQGYFDKKIFFPLILASVPFAFIGGYMKLDPRLFKILAGSFLIGSAVLLLVKQFLKETEGAHRKVTLPVSIGVGSVIGLFSGLIGVGGGIFLSPIMIMANWTDVKKASGIAALFILVNSISGLTGHLSSLEKVDSNILYWVLAVTAGGFAGSYFGTRKFDRKIIVCCLFVVLFSAGIKFVFIDQ